MNFGREINLNEIPKDEPVFLLRGTDPLAAETVRYWAERNQQNGGSADLTQLANEHAERMEHWHIHKKPDLQEICVNCHWWNKDTCPEEFRNAHASFGLCNRMQSATQYNSSCNSFNLKHNN